MAILETYRNKESSLHSILGFYTLLELVWAAWSNYVFSLFKKSMQRTPWPAWPTIQNPLCH